MLDNTKLIPISTIFDSRCAICGRAASIGTPVLWDKDGRKVYHHGCVGVNAKVNRTLIYDYPTNTVYLKFETRNKYLATQVKQIAGSFFEADGSWSFTDPDPISAKQLLELAESYQFSYDDATLTKLADLIILGTNTMLQSMARVSNFKVQGLRHLPFPFQESGVEFGVNNKRVIIADQMGLGKTIQAMGILSHLELFPAVIVCPAIIKLNWQREILAWILRITIEKIWTLRGRSPVLLPPADVYIVNYDILPDWLQQLQARKPKAIIFDEFHYLKTPGTLNKKKGTITGSKRSWAAKELVKNVEYIIGLTGTPILNRPEELIHPLRILGRLGEMGGKEYFEKRYCDGKIDNFHRWNTSGATNLKELNERLRANGILIRRIKKDVLPDLPRKMPPTVIPIELNNAAEYLRAEKNLAKWLGEKAVEDKQFKQTIAHLTPIEQLRASSNRSKSVEYLARKNEERSKFIYLKRLSTEGKTAGIKEHINQLLENGEKLLVFGWFRDTQVDFTDIFPQAVHALGKDSEKTRAEAVDKFQSDINCKLMIASLKVLGIGVNLTAASHVAFIELGWTPADHDQAEDRVHRIGQTLPVNVYYYVGLNTIEEDIIEIIDKKRKIIGAATDGVAPTHSDITNALIGSLLHKYNGK